MNAAIENHTNAKLSNWYLNAKRDHGVVGFGATKVEGNTITIRYTEDGVEKSWSMAFYPEYVEENGMDYFYNVWCE